MTEKVVQQPTFARAFHIGPTPEDLKLHSHRALMHPHRHVFVPISPSIIFIIRFFSLSYSCHLATEMTVTKCLTIVLSDGMGGSLVVERKGVSLFGK